MRKITLVVVLVLLFGFAGRGNAEPVAKSELFPDISGFDIERLAGHCDGGMTAIILNIRVNRWQRISTITRTEKHIFVVESKTSGETRYFTTRSGDAALQETSPISFEQYKTGIARVSPNLAKQLRGEPSDCVKF